MKSYVTQQKKNELVKKEKDNVYKAEIDFIKNEISEMIFEGEILC